MENFNIKQIKSCGKSGRKSIKRKAVALENSEASTEVDLYTESHIKVAHF